MGNPPEEKHRSVQQVLEDAVDKNSRGELSAAATAQQIDQLLDAKDESNIEDFLWDFFTRSIKLASKLSQEDPGQIVLVDVLKSLSEINRKSIEVWGNSHALWADLPLFGPCLREAFNLSPKFDGTDKDNAVVSDWVSLNSFSAKLLEKSVLDVKTYALWSLRSALEEGTENSPGDATALTSALKRDTDISVAHEWVTCAGAKLWENVQANTELDEKEKRVLAPGKLYAAWSSDQGEPGFNSERWEFWKQRLSDLAHEAEGSSKVKADRAVAMMNEIESKN